MTNAERQRSLDKKKWLESELCGIDRSGTMVYCAYCNYRNNTFVCQAEQKLRENECLCAKAYNRCVRNIK